MTESESVALPFGDSAMTLNDYTSAIYIIQVFFIFSLIYLFKPIFIDDQRILMLSFLRLYSYPAVKILHFVIPILKISPGIYRDMPLIFVKQRAPLAEC